MHTTRKFTVLLLVALLLFPPPANAAWASLGTLGSIQSKTANQSSLVLTTSAAAEAGNIVVACVATDNFGTTDSDDGAVSSFTDSAGGNTWTKAREWTNGQGTAQTGATGSLWYSKLTNQINSGGTITANFTNNTSRDATTMSAWELSIGAGNVVTVEGGTDNSTDGASYQSMSLSGLTSQEYLFLRCIATENAGGDTFTPTTSYSTFTQANTTGGAGDSNMTVRAEFRILTATGDTSSCSSSGAPDSASVYVAFKEAAPAARNRIWQSAKAGSNVTTAGSVIRYGQFRE